MKKEKFPNQSENKNINKESELKDLHEGLEEEVFDTLIDTNKKNYDWKITEKDTIGVGFC